MCTATDAASAAIDFSKGNVEEGVVDSPPSRGLVRTPICSPSPLKRTSSTPRRLQSQSPTPHTPMIPHRKLYADADGDSKDLHCNDGVPTPLALGHHPLLKSDLKADFAIEDRKRKAKLGAWSVGQSPCSVDIGSLPSKSMRGGPSLSAIPISRHTSVPNYRRSSDSRSTATADLYISNVNRLLPRPPRSSRSLSNSEISRSNRKLRSEVSEILKMGFCGAFLTASEQPKPSRREDIFRGLAKLKAQEAAKNKNNGETKRKFESVYTGSTMETIGGGEILQYCHSCCGVADAFDPGCEAAPHRSYMENFLHARLFAFWGAGKCDFEILDIGFRLVGFEFVGRCFPSPKHMLYRLHTRYRQRYITLACPYAVQRNVDRE